MIVACCKEADWEGNPGDGPFIISQEIEKPEEPMVPAHRTRSRLAHSRKITQDVM